MEDIFENITLYDILKNSGELELGANLLDPALSTNFTNRTDLGNSYFDTMVGASLLPTNPDNRINKRFGLGFGNDNLNLKALVDENQKSLFGDLILGNDYILSGGLTKNKNNGLSKQLNLQGQNFGANIADSDKGIELGVNAIFDILGGQANLSAHKNPYNKGIFGNIEWKF